MRVLIAADALAASWPAPQIADAAAAGWQATAPGDVIRTVPLGDGGPGFLASITSVVPGQILSVTVTDPAGEPTPAAILLHESGNFTTAYLEAAQACGLHLVPADRRDPLGATSYGVGQLLASALEAGAQRIVIGVGGTATTDGGAGLLAALGAGTREALGRGGGHLQAITADDLPGLADVIDRFAAVDLIAATATDVPLLGFHGASGGYAAAKGATRQQAQELERALSKFDAVVANEIAAMGERKTRRTLAPSQIVANKSLPGAGSGGGIGYALAVLGGRLLPGSDVIADAVMLDAAIADADAVLCVVGDVSGEVLRGGVVPVVSKSAAQRALPLILLGETVTAGRRELAAAGVVSAYAVVERDGEAQRWAADPLGAISDRAARVARSWSR